MSGIKMERKSFPVAEFKVLEADQGIIEAYVAVFGNKDYSNDIVMPGFFAETINSGKLPKGVWMHDIHAPIAKTLEAEEVLAGDPRLPSSISKFGGLRIKGQLNLNTQRGREAFEDLKFGTVDEFSFGYVAKQPKYQDGARLLYKGIWFEWSPVTIGDNPLTVLTSVKSAVGTKKKGGRGVNRLEIKGMFEEALEDRSLSLYNLFDVLCMVLSKIDYQEDASDQAGVQFDYEGAVREACGEFTERVVQGMVDEEAEEEAGEGMSAGDGQAEIETMGWKPKRLADGLGYTIHLKAVADAAQGIIRRTEARRELRTKEGRMLSSNNEGMLSDLADSLDVHAGNIRKLLDSNVKEPKNRTFDEGEMERKRRLVETALRMSGTLVN